MAVLPKALLCVDWGPCLWKPLLAPLKTVHQRQSFLKRSNRKLPPPCWKVEELIGGQEKFSDCKLDRLLGAPSALMFPLFLSQNGAPDSRFERLSAPSPTPSTAPFPPLSRPEGVQRVSLPISKHRLAQDIASPGSHQDQLHSTAVFWDFAFLADTVCF